MGLTPILPSMFVTRIEVCIGHLVIHIVSYTYLKSGSYALILILYTFS